MKSKTEPLDLAGGGMHQLANEAMSDYRLGGRDPPTHQQNMQNSPSNLNRNDLRQKMMKRKNIELLGAQGPAKNRPGAPGPQPNAASNPPA